MKHKGIIGWFTIFILLTFLVTMATAQSLRPVRNYGNGIIKAVAKDPAIVEAAQKGTFLDENSAASLKLKAAMKGKADALFAFVMNKGGVVVAASTNVDQQDYTKETFFTLPLKYGSASHFLSKAKEVYYYSLPVVAGEETVGVIAVAISPYNLLK